MPIDLDLQKALNITPFTGSLLSIMEQHVTSPLSQNSDNPFLQGIASGNQEFAGQLFDNLKIKTLDQIELTPEQQDKINDIRQFQGDDKANEAAALMKEANLAQANEPMISAAQNTAEMFPALQATNSLMTLQDMEKTESRFEDKRIFEDLSPYYVPSSQGFFEYGGTFSSVSADMPNTAGYLPFRDGAGVQTEVGEKIFIPQTGDIVDANADSRHTGMEKDEVTDYLPESSYVFSKWGFEIDRERAENIVVEQDVALYNAFEKQPVPKDVTLASIFKKEKESPADLIDRVNKKFEVLNEDDIFTQVTNNENKVNRMPYVQAIVGLSEALRPDQRFNTQTTANVAPSQEGPPPQAAAAPQEAPTEEVQSFGYGGSVVKKYPFGGIAIGLQAIGTIAGLLGNRDAKKQAEELMQQNLSDIGALSDQQQGLAQAGAIASLGAILSQDFEVDAPELNTRELDAIPTTTPRAFSEFQSNRLLGGIPTRQAFQNAPSFGAAMNSLSPFYAQAAQATSQSNLQMELDRLNREANKRSAIQQVDNQQAVMDANASNQERAGRNTAMTGVGSVLGGLSTTQANILANETANRLAARGAEFAATTQLDNQFSQSLLNAGAAAAQFSYMQPNSQYPQYPTSSYNPNFGISNTRAYNQANTFLANRPTSIIGGG